MRAILFTMLGILASGAVSAQEGDLGLAKPQETLRGQRVMRVVIEEIPAVAPALSAETLKAAVEAKLQQHGIRIGNPDAAVPYLYANINILKSDDHRYLVYSTNLSFARLTTVFIPGELEWKRSWGTVWQTGSLGMTALNDVEAIRSSVEAKVEQFLMDYFTANAEPLRRADLLTTNQE